MSESRTRIQARMAVRMKDSGLLAAVLLAACMAQAAMAQGPTVAIVLKVTNEVLQQAPDAEWAAASAGMQLTAGYRLRTGADSFAAVIFQDDQSLLKVSSNTSVTIDAAPMSDGSLSKKLRVDIGTVWARATKRQEATFEIETPTSVASVKGSAAYDSVDASGASRLYVEEGVWIFRNQFGAIEVGAGESGFSDGTGPPVLSRTEPGESPRFSRANLIPGIEEEEDPRSEQGENIGEIRIPMLDESGNERNLIIRYREER